MIYEKCRNILLKECELVQNAANIQERIRLAVINQEWTDFEAHFRLLNTIEVHIAQAEKERELLFDEFDKNVQSLDDKGRFYAIASTLPDEQKDDLSAIYHSLKLEAYKLRLANETLMSYLGNIKATLTEFFALAFPDRGGKMYTNTGNHFSHDMRCMVVNQSF
jgi:hypothetical protein